MKNFFKHSLPIGIIGAVVFLVLFITNAFYELIIPIVENSSIEGAAFKFWDNFIFYLPIAFIILFVAYAIAGSIINSTAETEEISSAISKKVDPMVKNAEEITKKGKWLSRDYYTVCPNCGSRRKTDERICQFCGSDLVNKDEKDERK